MTKRLLALSLALCLCFGSVAEAAWTHVQTKNNGSSGGVAATTCTVTPTSALITGNTSIISLHLLWSAGGSASGFSATDSVGNTYTQVASYNADTANLVVIFVSPSVSGSPTTVSISATAGGTLTYKDCIFDEFSGGSGSSAVNGNAAQKQVNPGTGTDAISSGSLTTTTDGDLIYAVSYSTNSVTNPTAGTGYTRWATGSGGGSASYIVSESQTQSVAGAISGTFTGGGATNTAITAAFALTTGGAVGGRNLLLGVGK
jgi:hypothetical protein